MLIITFQKIPKHPSLYTLPSTLLMFVAPRNPIPHMESNVVPPIRTSDSRSHDANLRQAIASYLGVGTMEIEGLIG